jgi:hypothetical protein
MVCYGMVLDDYYQLSNPIVQPQRGDICIAPGKRGELQASQAQPGVLSAMALAVSVLCYPFNSPYSNRNISYADQCFSTQVFGVWRACDVETKDDRQGEENSLLRVRAER